MDKGTQAYPLSNYAPGGEGGAILVVMFGNGVKIPLVPASQRVSSAVFPREITMNFAKS
jgi:hypothetical protein